MLDRLNAVIDLSTATFIGPEATDDEVLQVLPADYRALLVKVNGCVLFAGGLHVRGACRFPEWHSLWRVWIGPDALSDLYPTLQRSDIPFAQDVCGDQFLIRDGSVIRLNSETGDITKLGMTWQSFFDAAASNPPDFLSLQPLIEYTAKGGKVCPGELLSVYPPFCTAESASGVSLRTIPALDRIRFLADFAAQIRDLPENAEIRVRGE